MQVKGVRVSRPLLTKMMSHDKTRPHTEQAGGSALKESGVPLSGCIANLDTSSRQSRTAVKLHRCTQCEDSKRRRASHPASMFGRYSFNHTLGVDLIEMSDAVSQKFIAFNMLNNP